MTTKYSDQSRSNIVCLMEDPEYRDRKEVFLIVLEAFKVAGIHWALGCSMNLFLRGIVDEFHDIDLIVEFNDVEKVRNVLENTLGGVLVDSGPNECCKSDVYLHYEVGRVDLDIISGFKLVTFGTSFYYRLSDDEIDYKSIGNIEIPLIPIEVMFILYCMMEGWQPKRRFKRVLITEFLTESPIKRKEILQRELSNNILPGWIRWEIKNIISNS